MDPALSPWSIHALSPCPPPQRPCPLSCPHPCQCPTAPAPPTSPNPLPPPHSPSAPRPRRVPRPLRRSVSPVSPVPSRPALPACPGPACGAPRPRPAPAPLPRPGGGRLRGGGEVGEGGGGGAPGAEPLLWIRGAGPRGWAGGACEGTGSSGAGRPPVPPHRRRRSTTPPSPDGTFGGFPRVWRWFFFSGLFFLPSLPLGFPRAAPARPLPGAAGHGGGGGSPAKRPPLKRARLRVPGPPAGPP